MNLNTATKEQLEQIPFLTDRQVENLLAYLYSFGPMKTVSELQLVEEMDYDTRQLLSLFVYAGEEREQRSLPSLKEVLRYRLSVPSRGADGLVQAVWRPGERHSLLLKYRCKSKGKEFVTDDGRRGIDSEVQQKWRVQWHCLPSEAVSLKSTFDISRVDFVAQKGDCGYMFTQNFSFRPAGFPLSGDLTAACFSTDSYGSRLYMYERGLLYSLSFPSFYWGMRLALLLCCSLGTRLSLLAKYGCTKYFDRESIGSAQQQIDGSLKQDVQLQVQMKL